MTRAAKGATGQAGRATQPVENLSPSEVLQAALQQLAGTLTQRAVLKMSDRLGGATDRLADYALSGGGGGLLSAVTGVDKLSSGASPIKAAVSSGLAGAKDKLKDTMQGTLHGVKDSVLSGKGK